MSADKKRLYKHVEFLTKLKPCRDMPKSLDRAGEYIMNEFGELGMGSIKQMVPWAHGGYATFNVIGHYRPEKKKRLIVGAHYDTVSLTPGADDNASGVAGLLELARLVNEKQPDLPYGIEFVAFTLEEPPTFGSEKMGSAVHADSIKDPENIVGMICLEMIGYFSDTPTFGLGLSDSNFIVVAGKKDYSQFNRQVFGLTIYGGLEGSDSVDDNQNIRSGYAESGLHVVMADDPSLESLISLSDHRNYWTRGIPALMFNDTSHLRNPHYHQPTDTIDTLDFDKMTQVVSCIYKVITSLAPVKQEA